MERVHNRAAKEAMRITMLDHHQKRLPGHFKRGNRAKYKHVRRKPDYRSIKQFKTGSTTDIVHSGRTKREVSQYMPKIRVGGTATGPFMTGRIVYKFPFPVARVGKGVRAHPEQMAREIGHFTQEELNDAAEQFGSSYLEELEKGIAASPKLQKKLAAHQSANAPQAFGPGF